MILNLNDVRLDYLEASVLLFNAIPNEQVSSRFPLLPLMSVEWASLFRREFVPPPPTLVPDQPSVFLDADRSNLLAAFRLVSDGHGYRHRKWFDFYTTIARNTMVYTRHLERSCKGGRDLQRWNVLENRF